MDIQRQKLAVTTSGQDIFLYTVSNSKMSFAAMNYGCTITSIFLPVAGSKTEKTDILLGYSTFDAYASCRGLSFGSIVGRFANRIGGAKFSLDGKEYLLDKNDNNANTLHGGFLRYDHLVWEARSFSTKQKAGVVFTRRSVDGEQGFPGNLDISIRYTLDAGNNLYLEYKASTDKATPVNLTNHAYFNLAGGGSVLQHSLLLDCDAYLEVDENLIPTGKIAKCVGTPFDFLLPKKIGRDIDKAGGGYDNCFVTGALDAANSDEQNYDIKGNYFTKNIVQKKGLVRAAVLEEFSSGRKMSVYTNQEGIQVYTANWIEGVVGKNGVPYKKHGGVCLETQRFPDAPNKKEFPSCILRPGEIYNAVTLYNFDF